MTGRKKKLPIWFCVLLIALAAVVAVALIYGQDWLDSWKSTQTERETRALYPAVTTVQPAAAAEPAPSPEPTVALTDAPKATPVPTAASTALAAAPEATLTPEPDPVFHPDYPPVETPPPVQEDFRELYEKNDDVIGWLTGGDRIDYPVVWREGDNDFYLHHDVFGRSDRNGTLFLNGNNRFFPADDVWLIHGHNMLGGAMFGMLHRYRQMSYVKEHPLITFRTIYDADPVYYVAIAGFDASMMRGNSDYFDITQISFPDDEEEDVTATPAPVDAGEGTIRHSKAFDDYLASLRKRSLWTSPAEVNVDDSLLMLITCSYSQNDGRFILVCRKLRAEETPEDVTALFQEQ